jgi:hypothetical protein
MISIVVNFSSAARTTDTPIKSENKGGHKQSSTPDHMMDYAGLNKFFLLLTFGVWWSVGEMKRVPSLGTRFSLKSLVESSISRPKIQNSVSKGANAASSMASSTVFYEIRYLCSVVR